MGSLSWARRRGESRLVLLDAAPAPPPPLDHSGTLFGIVAEAVILQDEAEEVLAAVGRHEHLGVLAPRGGPLVHRFFALRDRLPRTRLDAATARRTGQLDTILLHHAMQVATALEFLAVEGRSERMARHVSAIHTLGPPADLLEQIYAELKTER